MTDNAEILTKVYGFVNRGKVCLAFKDMVGAFNVLNELSEYLVSVDCAPTPRAADTDKLADHLCEGCSGIPCLPCR